MTMDSCVEKCAGNDQCGKISFSALTGSCLLHRGDGSESEGIAAGWVSRSVPCGSNETEALPGSAATLRQWSATEAWVDRLGVPRRAPPRRPRYPAWRRQLRSQPSLGPFGSAAEGGRPGATGRRGRTMAARRGAWGCRRGRRPPRTPRPRSSAPCADEGRGRARRPRPAPALGDGDDWAGGGTRRGGENRGPTSTGGLGSRGRASSCRFYAQGPSQIELARDVGRLGRELRARSFHDVGARALTVRQRS
ncbi:unnamed protein product [Prorocentrum cordatum]|uniref:Apple domain-containing protein n=1 Tax=Prorocentrum cordatum TaxID=2364126 RepID=A0ABN9QKN4_9DINO|nr:unnamed protein product [Polarella glacialis]